MSKSKMFLLCCICTFISLFIFICHLEHNYSINGSVYQMEDGIVTFEDISGNLWEIKTEGCKFYLNEKVVLYFNDNCSNSDRTDDKITRVKKIEQK